MWDWGLNPGPLEGYPVILTAEPSLEPLWTVLKWERITVLEMESCLRRGQWRSEDAKGLCSRGILCLDEIILLS